MKVGKDGLSSIALKSFVNVTELMDLIKAIAEKNLLTAIIIGAIVKLDPCEELANIMQIRGKDSNFNTFNVGQAGTMCHSPSFADYVSLPLDLWLCTSL